MPKRSGKKPIAKVSKIGERDSNQMARSVMARIEELSGEREKDPAAVALGRKGGKKGGKSRMEQLSPEERSELARKAARARWGKKREGG